MIFRRAPARSNIAKVAVIAAVVVFATLAIATATALAAPADESTAANATITTAIGGKAIEVEVAADDATRQKGLSGRQTITGGMLFVYDIPRRICLWMQNTHISLEALFLHADGTIINTAQMIPHTTNPHCADIPAKYALELPADWRRQNQTENARRVIIPALPRGRE